jgi:hypothetical protein
MREKMRELIRELIREMQRAASGSPLITCVKKSKPLLKTRAYIGHNAASGAGGSHRRRVAIQ